MSFFDEDGSLVNQTIKSSALEKFEELMDKVSKQARSLSYSDAVATSAEKAIDAAFRDVSWPAEELRLVNWLIRASFPLDYGAEPKEVSLLAHESYEDLKGGEGTVSEGYMRIPERLAKGLDIKLNEKVVSITSTKENVVVSTSTGTTVTGCGVIVTVPLGVLQRDTIKFTPELTPQKKAAIQSLRMGREEKCILCYDKYWFGSLIKGGYSAGIVSKDPNEWGIFFDSMYEGKTDGKPCLVFFNGGSAIDSFASLSDADVKNKVVSLLTRLVQKNWPDTTVPEPVWYKVSAWHKDPFSWVGARVDDENQLFFHAQLMNTHMCGCLCSACFPLLSLPSSYLSSCLSSCLSLSLSI